MNAQELKNAVIQGLENGQLSADDLKELLNTTPANGIAFDFERNDIIHAIKALGGEVASETNGNHFSTKEYGEVTVKNVTKEVAFDVHQRQYFIYFNLNGANFQMSVKVSDVTMFSNFDDPLFEMLYPNESISELHVSGQTAIQNTHVLNLLRERYSDGRIPSTPGVLFGVNIPDNEESYIVRVRNYVEKYWNQVIAFQNQSF